MLRPGLTLLLASTLLLMPLPLLAQSPAAPPPKAAQSPPAQAQTVLPPLPAFFVPKAQQAAIKQALRAEDYPRLQTLLNADNINALLAFEPEESTSGEALLTPLKWAAGENRLALMKWLVETQKADVEALDREDDAALTEALSAGHLEAARYLVSKGADPLRINSWGQSMLGWAARSGNTDLLKWLQGFKPDLSHTNNQGYTAVFEAAEHGQAEAVKFLLAQGAPDTHGSETYTLLHAAAYGGSLELVKWLVETRKMAVDEPPHQGLTPFLYALYKGHGDVARYLLARGARPRQTDDYGRTALMLAAENGDLELVTRLVERDKLDLKARNQWQEDALIYAVAAGQLEVSQYLVARGLSLNQVSDSGQTPLMLAVKKGSPGLIGWMLSAGSELDARDDEGYTALANAAFAGRDDLVRRLLSLGADPRRNYRGGETLLMLAAQNLSLELVQWLHQTYQYDLAHRDADGQTTLMRAALSGNLELVQWLIAQGADPAAQDKYGNTVLLYAATSGNLALLQWLQGRYAFDLQHVNTYGESVLSRLMTLKPDLEAVYWLVRQGADLQLRSGYSNKSLLEAATAQPDKALLHWLWQTGLFAADDLNAACYQLAMGSHPGLIRELLPLGAQPAWMSESLILTAVSTGNLGLAQWLQARYPESSAHLLRSAQSQLDYVASSDSYSLPALEWLRQQGLQLAGLFAAEPGDSPLQTAAGAGQLPLVRWFLKQVPPAHLAAHKNAALAAAARSDALPLVKYLIDQGADPDTQDEAGRSLLLIAAAHGQLELMRYFHEVHQQDPDFRDAEDRNALDLAVMAGHLPSMRYLLAQGMNPRQSNLNGEDLIHAALSKNRLWVFQYLVDSLKLPLAPEKAESYWLKLNASYPSRALLRDFLARQGQQLPPELSFELAKALVDRSMWAEFTALMQQHKGRLEPTQREELWGYLLQFGQDELARQLEIPGMFEAGQNPALAVAAAEGNWQQLDRLLAAKKGDLEATSGYAKQTALAHAVEANHLPQAQKLLAAGADLQTRNDSGHDLLTLAAQNNELAMARWLFDTGSFDAQSLETAVAEALERGHLQMARSLKQWGGQTRWSAPEIAGAVKSGRLALLQALAKAPGFSADLSHDNRSLLHLAVESQSLPMVHGLLQAGAKVDTLDGDGTSPLMLAVQSGQLKVVEALVSAGANLRRRDTCGNSLLQLSLNFSADVQLFSYLLAQGVPVSAGTRCGQSSLLTAIKESTSLSDSDKEIALAALRAAQQRSP